MKENNFKTYDLKNLRLSASYGDDWTDIMPSLTKHTNTLKELASRCNFVNDNLLTVLFVALFSNLQEIKFSSSFATTKIQFKDFKTKFCSNLSKLLIIINDELNILRIILNNCQYLIWCGKEFLSEKEVLETIAKYSSKYFSELKLHAIH
ncbi:hypothetical protein C1645_827172 [Glomus cerebriforme]|uniref:Uncharacterized protein n=1 Tax=Glomus cerebriforme TaxID=658196 RepID=A0A397SSG7_9GLOM|nr:hypothetical protein C1645_827172 [Glomus cerebriforme]